MTVTVTFDQTAYSQGGMVNISGKVTDSSGHGISGAMISIQVVDPSGGTKRADFMISAADGTYTSQFRLAQDALTGVYTTFVVASKAGFTDARAQNTFQVTPTSQTSTTSTSSSSTTTQPARRGCLIATATFGTEASTEVVFLRELRDRLIGRTRLGAAFIHIYDQWYYSFSPQISNVISVTPSLKSEVGLTLYPLLAVLHATANLASLRIDEDAAIMMVGVFSSLALGGVYLSPIFFIPYHAVTRARRRKVGVKELTLPLLAAAPLTLLALAIDSMLMLEIGVATLAISSAVAGATIVLEGSRRLGQYF